MSIQAMAWVLERSRADGYDRLVLLAIANHADASGGLAWPSVARIASEAHVDRTTVHRALKRLGPPSEQFPDALDELEVISGGGRGRTNTYRLKLCPAATVKGRDEQPEQSQPATVKRNGNSGSQQQNSGSQSLNSGSSATLNLLEPSRTVPRAHARTRGGASTPPTDPEGSSSPTPTGPKTPGPKTAGPKTPDRCLACDLLIFDCLCDRGPLVRGIGRQ